MLLSNRFVSNIYWRFVLKHPRFRQRLTNLFFKDEDLEISIFGAPLLINKRKETGYWNAYKKSINAVLLRDETPVLLTLALLLEPHDTFVDVGANVGLYSSCLSKLQSAHPDMRFYAFEPNPDTIRRLRASVRGRHVDVLQTALSNTNKTLEFIEGASSGAFGAKKEKIGNFQIQNSIQRIEAKRLDDFDIEGNSIILKIDVEGHEFEVIKGASDLFNSHRIKAVYVDGYDDRSLPDYFREKGFKLFDGRTLQPEGSKGVEYSLLAIHKDHLSESN